MRFQFLFLNANWTLTGLSRQICCSMACESQRLLQKPLANSNCCNCRQLLWRTRGQRRLGDTPNASISSQARADADDAMLLPRTERVTRLFDWLKIKQGTQTRQTQLSGYYLPWLQRGSLSTCYNERFLINANRYTGDIHGFDNRRCSWAVPQKIMYSKNTNHGLKRTGSLSLRLFVWREASHEC